MTPDHELALANLRRAQTEYQVASKGYVRLHTAYIDAHRVVNAAEMNLQEAQRMLLVVVEAENDQAQDSS